jgi:hypothetical protein
MQNFRVSDSGEREIKRVKKEGQKRDYELGEIDPLNSPHSDSNCWKHAIAFRCPEWLTWPYHSIRPNSSGLGLAYITAFSRIILEQGSRLVRDGWICLAKQKKTH